MSSHTVTGRWFRVTRVAASALIASVLIIGGTGVASADPPLSNKNARPVTLTCGSETYQAVIAKATQFLLVDSTQTYVVTSLSSNGQLLFEVPGLASRSDQVTCTFSLDGRTFQSTGFFTPSN